MALLLPVVTPDDTPLRRLRVARGMTQPQLAAAADLGVSTIVHAERSIRFMSRRTATRCARVLGVTVEQLLCTTDTATPIEK